MRAPSKNRSGTESAVTAQTLVTLAALCVAIGLGSLAQADKTPYLHSPYPNSGFGPRYAVIDLGTNGRPYKITDSGYVLLTSDTNGWVWSQGQIHPMQLASGYTSLGVSDITEDGTSVGTETKVTTTNSPPGHYLWDHATLTTSAQTLWSTNGAVIGSPTVLSNNDLWQGFGFIPDTDPLLFYYDQVNANSGMAIDPSHNVWSRRNRPPVGDFRIDPATTDSFPGAPYYFYDCWSGSTEMGTPLANTSGPFFQGSVVLGVVVNNQSQALKWTTYWDATTTSSTNSVSLDSTPLDFAPYGLSNQDTNGVTYIVGQSIPGAATNYGYWYNGTDHTMTNFYATAINAAVSTTNNGASYQPAAQMVGSGYINGSWVPALMEMNPTNGAFGQPQKLEELIAPGSGWSGISVQGSSINDSGAIVGTATHTSTGTGDPIAAGSHGVLLTPAEMAVDANNDGKIVLANDPNNPDNVDALGNPLPVDTTSSDKPYQFWLNNDYDAVGAYSQYPTVQNDGDPSANTPDFTDGVITCTRDLEDFTLMCVYVKGFTDAIKNGDIQIGVKIVATSGAPAINLYQSYEGDGKMTYLTDATMATGEQTDDDGTPLHKIGSTIDSTHPLVIPKKYFNSSVGYAGLSATNSKRYFIFEATGRGKGKLILTFNKADGTEIGTGSVINIDLKDIKEMYERWTVGDGNGATPAASATLSTRALPSGVSSPFQYSSSGPEDKKYIVFVHGWNMIPWEKDSFAETAFKRLHWQGYKGRYAAFQWPTTYGFPGWGYSGVLLDRNNFDSGEYSAWRSGPALANLLSSFNSQCPGAVNVIGHSMGNVVTGEALRLMQRAGQSIHGYTACQAAVEAEAFDSTCATNYPLNFNYQSLIYGPTTPDIYPTWLGSTGSAVSHMSRFYNENDYALSPGVYEWDQISKPDNTGIALDWNWGITGMSSSDPNQFYSYIILPVYTHLQLGTAAAPADRYQIMAYAAEPRSRALGRFPGTDSIRTSPAPSSDVAGFSGSINVENIWPADTAGQGDHKDLQWHSAEFEFTNDQQKIFWNRMMSSFDISPHEIQNP